MVHLLVPFVALTLSLFIAAKFLDGMKIEGGLGSHIVVSVAFGLVNFFAGWCLFLFFTVITGGLALLLAFITRLVVTAVLLMVTTKVTKRLKVKGFGTAFVAALIMTVVGTATEYALHVLF